MFETNTASCGGFVGFSDAFGAALWGLDYAMQMASKNFSSALFHIGGQSVSYNPFTREFVYFLVRPNLIVDLYSTAYQRVCFPSMDRWADLLLCTCHCRGIGPNEHLANFRPRSEQ